MISTQKYPSLPYSHQHVGVHPVGPEKRDSSHVESSDVVVLLKLKQHVLLQPLAEFCMNLIENHQVQQKQQLENLFVGLGTS
ncbi:hypothetical protein YC2023_104837 [Brassica napus]